MLLSLILRSRRTLQTWFMQFIATVTLMVMKFIYHTNCSRQPDLPGLNGKWALITSACLTD